MNVTLTPQQDEFVRQKLETGTYETVSDLIRDAFELLDARDRLRRLRESIAEADRDVDAGNYEEWSPGLLQRIIENGKAKYEAGVELDPDVCP